MILDLLTFLDNFLIILDKNLVFLIVFIIESKETELNETQVNSLKVGGELSSRSQMLIVI